MNDKNIIYGIRSVIEAIESGKSLEKVFVKSGSTGELFQELMQLMSQKGINWQKVPVERINRFTTKNHQGVVATISPIAYQDIEELVNLAIESGSKPFILVLDGITDVRNFGAIARTAECAGVDAIVIPEKGGAPVNADAIKTSAGALFRVPVCRVSKMWYTMKFLKEKGFMLVGASEKSEVNYKGVNYTQPIALVVGAEDKGISSQVLKMMDQVVSIPVKGESGSLNVSVATGIIVYEIVANNS
ncbi:23S rRNA (guanosine(2251)-2'-O)-methyltransferase RlmB [Natronoflexus pectinivorans]|uniref:23S rRNA (Guanosine2251-2'-O)-methyltransferase n=1 Tax=Natronoflexus pectinivorans TaxID=682526 RepID=A0A4R2G4Y6_9BACT|nr:23S rRNA (guanosine(2251)-2'-O)-methyltransferase RlmB [Natronoflexus pectinivorans]TCO02706.1 23S rRNA (guanosine2251-2'-O)-methyltransferase [Natronoflexus pectinivorans]